MGKNSAQTIFKDIIGENFPELKKDDPSDWMNTVDNKHEYLSYWEVKKEVDFMARIIHGWCSLHIASHHKKWNRTQKGVSWLPNSVVY